VSGRIGSRLAVTGLRDRRTAGCVAVAITWGVVVLAAGAPAPAASSAKATPAHGNFAGQVAIGDGRKLYLRCKGSGRPAVILESGIHDSSDTWKLTQTEPPVRPFPAVFSGAARFTRVCRYDRPGTIRYTNPPRLTTRSTPVKMPRTLPEMATDLHRLLRRSGLRGPYVLAGHSFGGMIVRLFAQTHPSKVAGLVLVDAFGTNIRHLFGPTLWPVYVKLLNHPGTALDSDPRFEAVRIDRGIRAVRRARALPRVPLAVMSKTEPFATAPGVPKAITTKLEKVWPLVQDKLVTLEPQTPHIVATGSGHYVQIEDPDLTIGTIRLIVHRAIRARRGDSRPRVGYRRSGRSRIVPDQSPLVHALRRLRTPSSLRLCAGPVALTPGLCATGSRESRSQVRRTRWTIRAL
jgi:pimeloyl-ACP methyl ester carboxylesterase